MLEYILLGVVQGLTEFLPVSSSGHLAILGKIFGLGTEAVAVSVVLHLGTCLALVLFFVKDIVKLFRTLELLIFIFVVTLITGIIGLGGKHFFEALFTSAQAVGIGWAITGVVLLSTARNKAGRREIVGIVDALILGLTQGLAIAPGVSRSGITIATLLFRKMDWESSFRLSFLAAIPAIFGATFLEAKEIHSALQVHAPVLAAGFIASFVSGLLALWILKNVMRKAKLHIFGYYCIIIAILTLVFIR